MLRNVVLSRWSASNFQYAFSADYVLSHKMPPAVAMAGMMVAAVLTLGMGPMVVAVQIQSTAALEYVVSSSRGGRVNARNSATSFQEAVAMTTSRYVKAPRTVTMAQALLLAASRAMNAVTSLYVARKVTERMLVRRYVNALRAQIVWMADAAPLVLVPLACPKNFVLVGRLILPAHDATYITAMS